MLFFLKGGIIFYLGGGGDLFSFIYGGIFVF